MDVFVVRSANATNAVVAMRGADLRNALKAIAVYREPEKSARFTATALRALLKAGHAGQ